MIKKSNSTFDQICDLNEILSSDVILPEGLTTLLAEEIVDRNGCYYYRFLAPNGPFSKEFGDKTGNEASYNKILIEDYLNEEIESSKPIKLGVLYAVALLNKLSEEIESADFIVIFSNDGLYSSVTFHKKRVGESWLSDDLEKYKINSLLVLSLTDSIL